MCPGLSDDLKQIDDARKTAIINRELKLLDIDIAALQEKRLAADGIIREHDYFFFWQGKEPDEPRTHGAGFTVKNSILSSIEPPSEGTQSIFALRLSSATGLVNILSVYAPTLNSSAETKYQLYEDFATIIITIPATEEFYLFGDFNALIGADHDFWPLCIGHFGVGKLIENGQRLLEMCTFNNFCVTNTYFQSKPQQTVSWRLPRSRHWHQLDLIFARRASLNSVKKACSDHIADCDTNHSLVAAKVRLNPRRIHNAKQKGRPRINTSFTCLPGVRAHFLDSLQETLNCCLTDTAEERWGHICEAIYNSAMDSFGKREKKITDWFEAGITELEPVISAKRDQYHRKCATPP